MTALELVEDATRRVCERTGADAREVRDAIAHAVQVYVGELEAANDGPDPEDVRIASMTQEEWEHEHSDGSSDVYGDSW